MPSWSRKKQLQALDTQVTALRAELYTGETQLRDVLAAHEATIAAQQATIAALTARLDGLEAGQAERLDRIEARLGEVSEQLLHQLEELGTEIDAAGRLAQQQAEAATAHAGTLDTLRDAQTRLAAEQVRYDLALRAELAEVADRLRRTGRG